MSLTVFPQILNYPNIYMKSAHKCFGVGMFDNISGVMRKEKKKFNIFVEFEAK